MRKSAISRYLRIPRSHSGLTNVITTKDVGKLPDALLRLKDSGITVLPLVRFRRIRQNSSPPLL